MGGSVWIQATGSIGFRRSGIVDGLGTMTNEASLVLYVRYDNDFGDSCQMVRP